MRKSILTIALLLTAAAAMAGEVLFSSKQLPKKVKISWELEELISNVGEEEKFKTITPAASGIVWQEKSRAHMSVKNADRMFFI